MSNPSPDKDGMVRCMDCTKSRPVTRTIAIGRAVTANACFADESDLPLRPMLDQEKWRRCKDFAPRPSRDVVSSAIAGMRSVVGGKR